MPLKLSQHGCRDNAHHTTLQHNTRMQALLKKQNIYTTHTHMQGLLKKKKNNLVLYLLLLPGPPGSEVCLYQHRCPLRSPRLPHPASGRPPRRCPLQGQGCPLLSQEFPPLAEAAVGRLNLRRRLPSSGQDAGPVFPESSLDRLRGMSTSVNFSAEISHQQEETHSLLNADDGRLLPEEAAASVAPPGRGLDGDDRLPHLHKLPPDRQHSDVGLDASRCPGPLLRPAGSPAAERSLDAHRRPLLAQETASLPAADRVAAHPALQQYRSLLKPAILPALQAAPEGGLQQDDAVNGRSVIHPGAVPAEHRLDDDSGSDFQQEVPTTPGSQQRFSPASLDPHDGALPSRGRSAGEETASVSLQKHDPAHVFPELAPRYQAAELPLDHRGGSVSGLLQSPLARSPRPLNDCGGLLRAQELRPGSFGGASGPLPPLNDDGGLPQPREASPLQPAPSVSLQKDGRPPLSPVRLPRQVAPAVFLNDQRGASDQEESRAENLTQASGSVAALTYRSGSAHGLVPPPLLAPSHRGLNDHRAPPDREVALPGGVASVRGLDGDAGSASSGKPSLLLPAAQESSEASLESDGRLPGSQELAPAAVPSVVALDDARGPVKTADFSASEVTSDVGLDGDGGFPRAGVPARLFLAQQSGSPSSLQRDGRPALGPVALPSQPPPHG